MATTFNKITNRGVSSLLNGINASVTELIVQSGDGALFPSTYPFNITIDDEIVKCTNRSTDTMTVVRAQEGTAAATHAASAEVALNITAKIIDDITGWINTQEDDLNAQGIKWATTPWAAEVGNRGFMHFVEGGAGVADKLYCIMKGADDNYTAVQVAIG